MAGNRRGDLIVLQTILRILQFALGIFYALFRRFQGILDRLKRIVRRLLRIGKQRCALMDIASLFHGHRRNFPAVIGGDRLFQLCGERPSPLHAKPLTVAAAVLDVEIPPGFPTSMVTIRTTLPPLSVCSMELTAVTVPLTVS